MKNILFILVLGSFLYSCTSDLKEVKIYYQNSKTLKKTYQVDKKGLKQGEYKEFYKDGKLKEKGSYYNSNLDRVITTFDEQGHLEKKIFASKGVLSKAVFYDENGSKTEQQFYDSKGFETQEINYYENGKVKSKLSLFIGTGQYNASIYFSPNGEIDNKKSEFLTIENSANKLKFNLYGRYDSYDSIEVLQVKNYLDDSNSIISRRKFLNKNGLVINKSELIYQQNMSNIRIKGYKTSDNMLFIKTFDLQIDKTKGFPKNNLHPIYSEVD
ncbi:hypothetical protein [Fluviicola sp.]|uniref:hypothetical protein n=1 Tax=Fluviicola sp. TaxID=1917219 RepID=UPI003D2A7054